MKPNAAPVCEGRYQFQKPSITGTGVDSGRLDSNQALVHWSRAMTMTETTSQDSALGWGWRMGVLFILSYVVRVRLSSRARRWSTQSEPLPVLARPFDVGHAAPAQLRMRGIVADVGTVMPAAHADRKSTRLNSSH